MQSGLRLAPNENSGFARIWHWASVGGFAENHGINVLWKALEQGGLGVKFVRTG